MPNQRHVSKFAELDGGGVFSGKKSFTRMQIKPKILQGRTPKIAYITGVENTINPFNNMVKPPSHCLVFKQVRLDMADHIVWRIYNPKLPRQKRHTKRVISIGLIHFPIQ